MSLQRLLLPLLIATFSLGLLGCEEEAPPQPSAAEIATYEDHETNATYAALDLDSLSPESRELVEKAKVLAEARKKIEANPERREAIIAETGFSVDEIDELVRHFMADDVAQSVYIDGL